MGCVLCHKDELYVLNGMKEVWRHDKDISFFLCSNCIQGLMQMPKVNVIEAYHSAIEEGHSNKAHMLLHLRRRGIQ